MFLWLICILFIGFSLYRILTNEILPGWDLSPHSVLVEKMLELLKAGKITGYDLTGRKWWTTNGPASDNTYLAKVIVVIGNEAEQVRAAAAQVFDVAAVGREDRVGEDGRVVHAQKLEADEGALRAEVRVQAERALEHLLGLREALVLDRAQVRVGGDAR